MANEFKHKTVGTELTQSEWEAIGTHVFDSQSTGDICYASSGTQLSRLGIGSTGNLLATKSGVPAWIGGSSSSPTSYTAGTPLVAIYATNAGTSGGTSAEPFYVKSTLTGAAQVGGRARFHTYSNVASGGWVNALKTYMEFGASGSASGLGSSLCAETVLSAGTSSGTYCALEAELVAASGASTGTATSFLYCNCSDASGNINDNAFLFELGAGLTSDAAHLWYDNTANAADEFVRVKTPSGTRYLALSDDTSWA